MLNMPAMVSSNERGTLYGNREATHTGLVGKPTKPYRGASNAVELGTVLILGKSWIDAGHGSRSSRHCATRWRWHTVAFSHRPARPASAGLGGPVRRRACHRRKVRRPQQCVGLYRDDARPQPRYRDPRQYPNEIGRCILLDFAGIEHASRRGSPR